MPLLVVEVRMNHRHTRLVDNAVTHVYVLQTASAHRIRLETYRIIEIRAVKEVAIRKHVSYTTGYLTACSNTAMAIREAIPTDNDVLRRYANTTAILISSRLDCDTVITCQEVTAVYQHILR